MHFFFQKCQHDKRQVNIVMPCQAIFYFHNPRWLFPRPLIWTIISPFFGPVFTFIFSFSSTCLKRCFSAGADETQIAGCTGLTGANILQIRALQRWQLLSILVLIKATLLSRWTSRRCMSEPVWGLSSEIFIRVKHGGGHTERQIATYFRWEKTDNNMRSYCFTDRMFTPKQIFWVCCSPLNKRNFRCFCLSFMSAPCRWSAVLKHFSQCVRGEL